MQCRLSSLQMRAKGSQRNFTLMIPPPPSPVKCGRYFSHPIFTQRNVIGVLQSFSSSLDRLGVSRVDAYILHAPYESAVDTLEAWQAMEAIHQQGRALQLGVSNFDLEQLHQLVEIATVSVHIVQNRCKQDTGCDKAVREYCAQSSIKYQVVRSTIFDS